MKKLLWKLVIVAITATIGLTTSSCEGGSGSSRLVGKTYRHYEAEYDDNARGVVERTYELHFISKTQCKINKYGYDYVSDGWDEWADDIKWKKQSWSDKRTVSYTNNDGVVVIKDFNQYYGGGYGDIELTIGDKCLYNNSYTFYLL